MSESVFNTLNGVNVQEFIEKKNGLSYLTWSKAWEAVKSRFADASYTIVKDEVTGLPYFHDPATGYMVMTTVTVNGETLEMWLPVMDFKNNAMLEPTMTNINKTLMRCLAKNLAMFGLGLYVYAGQDLPTEEEDTKTVVRPKEEVEKQYIPAVKVTALEKKCASDGVKQEKICIKCKVASLEMLTEKQFAWICANWTEKFVNGD